MNECQPASKSILGYAPDEKPCLRKNCDNHPCPRVERKIFAWPCYDGLPEYLLDGGELDQNGLADLVTSPDHV